VSLLLAAAGPCGGDDDDEPTPSATATGTSVVAIPEDPLPAHNDPGPVTCEGCPESDIADFEPDFGNEPAHRFTGRVARAAGNGRFYVMGEDGESYGGNIETDSDGNYSVTVPLTCGEQTIKLAWTNDRGSGGAVMAATTSGCQESDIRLTLAWDDAGSDFELHLVREGGTINDNAEDCTWTSCIGQAPDWGRAGDAADNPSKDVDDVDAFGPENIVYPGAADGTYTVLVEHWGAGRPGATGSVVINVRGRPPVELPIESLDPQHVLIVATIEWPGGEVRPVLRDHDCTGNWAAGCRDAIP
jgi:hypothetical protein